MSDEINNQLQSIANKLMLGSVKKVAGLLELAGKYSTFLFDLDGVVVRRESNLVVG